MKTVNHNDRNFDNKVIYDDDRIAKIIEDNDCDFNDKILFKKRYCYCNNYFFITFCNVDEKMNCNDDRIAKVIELFKIIFNSNVFELNNAMHENMICKNARVLFDTNYIALCIFFKIMNKIVTDNCFFFEINIY